VGIVYVLKNEAMPGVVKIGLTEADVEDRILSLDNTSVPLPFECYYAARIEDAAKVEKALHTAFDDHRVRKSREFFEIDPYRVQVLLELHALEDVTPRDDIVESPEDSEAVERTMSRRPPFRFSMANIPVGATLEFVRDGNETATVVNDSTIHFRGEETSLSAAAVVLMQEAGYRGNAYAGPAFWLYDGKTLSEHRNEAGNW
jgi:hypothetical protein